MKKLRDGLVLLFLVLLTGCGSAPVAQPNTERPKKAEPPPRLTVPAAPVAPAAPEKPRVSGLQALSSTPEAPPVPQARSQQQSQSTTTTVGEFAPGFIGGKSIQTWISLLESSDKNKVLEAIAALGMAREKGKPAVPKLQELAKSSDKEIASDAADALKVIGQ